MICCLVPHKPLLTLVQNYCPLNLSQTNKLKVWIEIQLFTLEKYIWTCCLLDCNIIFRFQSVKLISQSHNAFDKYPTMYHFVTEMCTHVHISVTKWCIVGYMTGALWDCATGLKTGILISNEFHWLQIMTVNQSSSPSNGHIVTRPTKHDWLFNYLSSNLSMYWLLIINLPACQ